MQAENHHLEHHLFPSVPACRLPEPHRRLAPHLPRRVAVTGYGRYLLALVVHSLSGREEWIIGRLEGAPDAKIRPGNARA